MTRPSTSHEGEVAPDPVDEALCRIYGDWRRAMEDGSVFDRLPDPLYQWRGHAPSVEEMAALLRVVDAYMEEQAKGWAHSRGFETGTHFHYLPEVQQWAMLQELDRAIPPPAPAFTPEGAWQGQERADA